MRTNEHTFIESQLNRNFWAKASPHFANAEMEISVVPHESRKLGLDMIFPVIISLVCLG
jgi:hypothetical protein